MNWSRLDGINSSEKSSSWKVIAPPFSATRTPVNLLFIVAGLTVGDPVMRTKEPLSVELGPGILT